MAPETAGRASAAWERFAGWAERVGLSNKLMLLLIVAAVVSGAATYAALVAAPPFGKNPDAVFWLLNLTLGLLLLFGALVIRRIAAVWLERRRGMAGSQLHVRLVAVISLLVAVPTGLVAVFSAVFLHVVVQSWFAAQVRTTVEGSTEVARAYLREHQRNIMADALALQRDITNNVRNDFGNQPRLNQTLGVLSVARGLPEALVFDGTLRPRASTVLSLSLELSLPLYLNEVERARSTGEVVLIDDDSEGRIRALVTLDRFSDTFLMVGRPVDPSVVTAVQRTEDASQAYQQLEARRTEIQITISLIFFAVAFLLLLVAIWLAQTFATQLVQPIGALIAAAERVRAGDLTARVAEAPAADDEIATLSRAFNRMTTQIEQQRSELVEANHLLDHRRRFTEAVLTGVSSGVIGLDAQGRVTLPNHSAAELLGVSLEAMIGRSIVEVLPEINELLPDPERRSNRIAQGEIKIRRGQTVRTLLVRVAAERSADDLRGYVVTFDDISELLQAQRKAAWADVARRIAHEIKNPLTPIQLSAERLKRRYLKEISSDTETFKVCVDTIVRQVDDIRQMVDEFSAFARMPQPVMKPENLIDVCRRAVVLQQTARSDIRIVADLPSFPVVVPMDSRQIGQALTNLLQNAIDAIEGRPADQPQPPGEVVLGLSVGSDGISITVEDNGKGLPTEDRDRLTEPYVTTRAKGTGLGLAIVKKIMEDHAGFLTLEDREPQGARVRLTFPVDETAAAAVEPHQHSAMKTASHGA